MQAITAIALTDVHPGKSKEGRTVVRVIILDLDDTLVDDVNATREAIALTLVGLRLPASHEAVGTALTHIRRLWARHPHRHTGPLTQVSAWEALWLPTENTGLPEPAATSLPVHEHRVWGTVLATLGGDVREAPSAALAFRQARHSLLRLLPGAREALHTMQREQRLWLATNGLPRHQRAKLNATGLDSYFDRVLISGELGSAKSEPAFAATVRAMLEQDGAGVCMVVGDSFIHDVGLATHGGWAAVHLCRTSPCPAQAGVSHVSSLADAAARCYCPARAESVSDGYPTS
jgi:FMN phosphatase YigB (HAD superfamily)